MLLFEKVREKEQYSGPSRAGFTFTYCPQLHISILLGGCKDNDVYIFDHNKQEWSSRSISPGKKHPQYWKYHAAAVIQSISGLIVSGGQDQRGHSLDDIYILTFRDWKWKKLLLHKSPLPRQRHTLIPLSKTQLLLFGGISMPYGQHTNDCWVVSLKSDSKNDLKYQSSFDCSQLPTKGVQPDSACFAESTVLVGDRLFTGGKKGKTNVFQFYSLQLRAKQWKKLELNLKVDSVKFYKIISQQRDENLILSTSSQQSLSFHLFNCSNLTLTPLEIHSQLDRMSCLYVNPCSVNQIGLYSKAKNICTVQFRLDESLEQPPSASIEDFLIAIKHEQILSQQLNRKNALLQQLYKEMQNYITSLNREYQQHNCDLSVENQKSRHIEDCQHLKSEYSRLNTAYEQAVSGIKAIRSELSSISQDFERCIQTQFDQQS